MPKTKQKLQKKHKEFYSLHPSLSYIKYADSKQLDRNSTNIGYKSTLESLKNSGNRECRKQAMDQNTLFEVSLYWELFIFNISPAYLLLLDTQESYFRIRQRI